MSKHLFRKVAPKRSYSGPELHPYGKYKKLLRQDFNKRCGYTDCPDIWFGGTTNFQIDHFQPKSLFPALTTCYTNLVYCCSFVNRAKSNDFDKKLYLDPCKENYNKHFSRDAKGNILPAEGSPAAQYMYKKLKLYLKRYGIIWMLDTIQEKMATLHTKIARMQEGERKKKLVTQHYLLSQAFQSYLSNLGMQA